MNFTDQQINSIVDKVIGQLSNVKGRPEEVAKEEAKGGFKVRTIVLYYIPSIIRKARLFP